jgi:hypothetical protein
MRLPLLAALFLPALHSQTLDLTSATVVARPGDLPAPERTAARVLVEELERRTGVRLNTATTAPAQGPFITLSSLTANPAADGYELTTSAQTVTIRGDGPRGALYGVGHLLRHLHWSKGRIELPAPLNTRSTPKLPIRGHQIGYRATANSWDAWTVAQYEQYVRELALFGMNALEGIPLGDDRRNPLAQYPKRDMNRAIAGICARYGLDYWIWTPVSFEPADATRAAAYLDELSQIARDSQTLTGVFVPGGDPGHNPPETLLPFLAKMAERIRAVHPKAQIWLSLQGFDEAKAATVYRWIASGTPPWFGGLVAGPSSPPVADTRRRIPAHIPIRLYPDVSHNVRSQFEVPEWDQAYALTLGREAVNPRPYEYAARHRKVAPLSAGAITYSDGVHDDVNKVVWTALDWDPTRDPRQILTEYARLHFSPAAASEIADAILALERNWRGPLLANGAVESTLRTWNDLDRANPALASNWRWQMHHLRAIYDVYIRRRLVEDASAEADANRHLLNADTAAARAALARPTQQTLLRGRIVDLCEQLWQSIRLQTSVEKYGASNPERGAVLDFIDLPLNNRWWLEDEIAKAESLPAAARSARLRELATWENPGEGSFYDALGNIAKMPRAERDADEFHDPLFWWRDLGKSRQRRSWLVSAWPKQMVYEGLDPSAKYVVRTTGYGQALLKMDGMRVRPVKDGQEIGEMKEFPVPPSLLTDARLVLTWDRAGDEEHLNWRQQSRLSEVWLIKLP